MLREVGDRAVGFMVYAAFASLHTAGRVSRARATAFL
jgi:hypothetical protein